MDNLFYAGTGQAQETERKSTCSHVERDSLQVVLCVLKSKRAIDARFSEAGKAESQICDLRIKVKGEYLLLWEHWSVRSNADGEDDSADSHGYKT